MMTRTTMTEKKPNRYGTGAVRGGRPCCGHNTPLDEACRPCELLFLTWVFYGDDHPEPTLFGVTDYGAAIRIPRDHITDENLDGMMGRGR